MDDATLRGIIAARLTPRGPLTVYAAGKLSGLSQQTIHEYLAGADARISRVLRLAAAVGVEISAAAREGPAAETPAIAGGKRPRKKPAK